MPMLLPLLVSANASLLCVALPTGVATEVCHSHLLHKDLLQAAEVTAPAATPVAPPLHSH